MRKGSKPKYTATDWLVIGVFVVAPILGAIIGALAVYVLIGS